MVGVDGVPVIGAAQLQERIGLAVVGQMVRLSVDRHGAEQTIAVPVAPAGKAAAARLD